jgi:chromosome segregation ATPase
MNPFSSMSADDIGGENGIAAVATRIQERALELVSERAAVELAKAEMEEIQQALDEETKKNGAVRRTMLSIVRSRHGLELELWKVKDQQEERLTKIFEYECETEKLNDGASELEEVWEETVRDLYVDHDMQRELFSRSVQGRIRRRENHIKDRERRLRQLQQESKQFEQEEKRMVHQTNQLKSKIAETNERKETEDEEVAALAMQIRSTVAKVSRVDYCV